MIKKPFPQPRIFAEKSTNANFTLAPFGKNLFIEADNYSEIANNNFRVGLESVTKPSSRDLNSLFHYLTKEIAYLYQQGIAEYNAYINYPKGAVVQHNNAVYVAQESIVGVKEPSPVRTDSCGNPCPSTDPTPTPECVLGDSPSEAPKKWLKLATAEDLASISSSLETVIERVQDNLNEKILALEETVLAHQKTFIDFRTKMENFTFATNTNNTYVFHNFDGTHVTIQHRAGSELRDATGTEIIGYAHTKENLGVF